MPANGSVLLDTNVVVAHLRHDPELTARLQLTSLIYLPWIVLAELHYGACRAQRREAQLAAIREFVRTVVPLFPDEATCEEYGVVKAELAAKGRLIPENDIWIAAIARQYEVPLVTRDAHFESVDGLTVQRW